MSASKATGTELLAPVGVDGFFQPRRAAFWLMIFFIANGLFSMITQFYTGYRVVPTSVLFGLVVWTLYVIPFLLFFRALDLFEQHPPLGFVMAFGWGGLAAVYLAIPANSAITSIMAKAGSPEFAAEWGPAIAGPSNEETLKILGVILLVLVARTQFPTILSVVVAGAMVGLGFQVVEDLSYSINAAIGFVNANEVVPVALVFGVRGIVSGIWSHAMFTSVSAFGVGYFLTRKDKPLVQRILVAVAAFAVAWTLHFFWNSPSFADLGFAGQTVIHAIPVAIVGYLVWRLAGREEGAYLRSLADHYVGEDLITPDERRYLPSLRERRSARQEAKKTHGRAAEKALRALQREQVRLVMYYGRHGAGPRLADHEYAVRRARARRETAEIGTEPKKMVVER